MGTLKTPRHFIEKPGADGPRWFWQPSSKLRKAGWSQTRVAEGGTLDQAFAECEAINARLDAWRAGADPGPNGRPAKRKARPQTLGRVIEEFLKAEEFLDKRPDTRREYERLCTKVIAPWAGDTRPDLIEAPRVKRFYRALQRRDAHGRPATLSQANATIRVLSLLYRFAISEGFAKANPTADIRLKGTPPRVAIFLPRQIDLLVEAADLLDLPSIGDAVLCGKYLGQRQADLLGHTWVRRQNGRHYMRQSKTGTQVEPREVPRLAARLDAARARLNGWDCDCPHILVCEATGRRWGRDNFRHRFAEVRAAAAAEEQRRYTLPPGARPLSNLWFSDLRDTAATGLAEAGCTIPEICAITGHSLKSATAILEHYLKLTGELADNAIRKLIDYETARSVGSGAEA